MLFIVPEGGRFGTIVIGDAETHEHSDEESIEFNVRVSIGDWKRALIYEMMMRNLIEELNKEEVKEFSLPGEKKKLKYDQIIMNIGL